MAIYNLARGGNAPEFGKGCIQCGESESGLPHFLQPDLRVDGGYGFRDKIEWKQLMHNLEVRYGKTATDLQEGDQLYIFLQPNHSTVKSLFVDFREPVAGFKFELKSANEVDYAGKQTQTTYSQCLSVENVQTVEEFDTGAVPERTQWTNRIDDGYSPKVDAVVLEIKALPKNGDLNAMKLLFARRFEQDGYMM